MVLRDARVKWLNQGRNKRMILVVMSYLFRLVCIQGDVPPRSNRSENILLTCLCEAEFSVSPSDIRGGDYKNGTRRSVCVCRNTDVTCS